MTAKNRRSSADNVLLKASSFPANALAAASSIGAVVMVLSPSDVFFAIRISSRYKGSLPMSSASREIDNNPEDAVG